MKIIAVSIFTCFRKCFHFSGTASRAEFWWFSCFSFLVLAFAHSAGISIYVLPFLVLPLIAATARRFHDAGEDAGAGLIFIFIPCVVFVLFSLIEQFINESFGIVVPYRLITNIPTGLSVYLFGSAFLFNLLRKSKTLQEHTMNSPSAASEYKHDNDKAISLTVAARSEAERKHEQTVTHLVQKFGLQKNEIPKMDGGRDASIITACEILTGLSVRYGVGFLVVDLSKLFSDIEDKLLTSGWFSLQEGGQSIDLQNQTASAVLSKHDNLLRQEEKNFDIEKLLSEEREKILEFRKNPFNEIHETKYYVLGDSSSEAFIAVERLKPNYSDTYLKMRLSFAESDSMVAMKALRTGTLYEAFRYSFSDIASFPLAFESRIIKASAPLPARDGISIDLTAKALKPYSAKILSEKGFKHPYCYIEFGMLERMM